MTTTFGLILPIQVKDRDLSELFDELVEEVQAAEAAGFTHVFLPEFHQAHGGALVSPYLLGSALLQATSTIRFGAAVLAGPLHHPVRLAEDLVMLDWISKGRAVLGLGIGHQVPDFEMFGVDRDARGVIVEEMLDVIEGCFSGEPWELHGEHFDLAGQVTPGPLTPGGPEIWMGAHARVGLERAGRRADVWISDPQRDTAHIKILADRYRGAAEANGRTPRVALFREGWIGDSRAECEEVWAPYAMQVHRLYYNVGVYRKVFEPWVDEVRDRADFTLDRLAPGRFLYGSPEEVRDTVEEWVDVTGAEHIALRMRHPGGPGHEATLEAIRRFGAEVIGRV
ncbi:MAG TPA: LLM class flavin-dependent oxidoreductase [Acidimicrobiia bacterium]|nr:LLM class flavin-dependent oxidoreductase [Acidimicrobiia bacterium]